MEQNGTGKTKKKIMKHPCLEDNDDSGTFFIVVLQWQGQYHWYCSFKEDWILDQFAYSKAFGIANPQCADRYGICILSEETIEAFMGHHMAYALDLPTLADWLSRNFPLRSRDGYDSSLFPTLFIDFDARSLYSLFMEYAVFETFIPHGWKGETVDFSGLIPVEQRYWVQGDRDWWETMILLANQAGQDE